MTFINRRWCVARYPDPGDGIGPALFDWQELAVPEPTEGQFLVRTLCLAPGPAQRGYLEGNQSDFFGARLPLGEVMRGRGLGRVIASRHPDFAEGDLFVGSLGWQDYSIQTPAGKDFIFSTRKITSPASPLALHLGTLGQAGGTAYFGLHEGGSLREGDRVLVSAAAGGVGSVAGQVARIGGAARVVGLAGSDSKCAWLRDELGFDAALNHRSPTLGEELADQFPEGIDLFFDNVGGRVLDTVLPHLAMGGRIALCGFISTQYAHDVPTGPANYPYLIFKRARMQGFVYFDYWDRYDEAERHLKDWYEQGLLRPTESVDHGLENMPNALAALFTGANRGIKLCQVAPDDAGT